METIGDYNSEHFFKTQKQDSFLNQSQNDNGSRMNETKVENNRNIYIADWQVEYPENQPGSFKPVVNVGLSSHR